MSAPALERHPDRCGILHPAHPHLACSMRAGHSGGHRAAGAWWPRRAPVTPPRQIAAREVAVGDRVRVVGIGSRRAVSFAVELVEVLDSGDISLGGRSDRGAWHFRTVAPLSRVEVRA